jgi:hypothetical protein
LRSLLQIPVGIGGNLRRSLERQVRQRWLRSKRSS